MPLFRRPGPRESTPQELAAALDELLLRHSVECWFPRCVDDAPDGGFHQDYDREWNPQPTARSSVVFQARMVWVTATLARCRPDLGLPFASWAERGLAHLRDRFRDPGTGGVAFWKGRWDETHAYPVSFVLFGTAALQRATGSPAAASFAAEVFDWFDRVGWDDETGAYREALPLRAAVGSDGSDRDLMRVPRGCTSSNAQLHIVEALTELLRAGGDPRVASRLRSVLGLLEARVVRDGGRLSVTWDASGRPRDRGVSFGHDVEAFHLAVLARETLGLSPETPLEGTAHRALHAGLDRRLGGVYSGRRPFRPVSTRKVFWAQAEVLAGLALLHRRGGVGSERALDDLAGILRFARAHMVDQEHGGWAEAVTRRGRRLTGWKGHAWKAAYHEVRGLLHAIHRLRGRDPDGGPDPWTPAAASRSSRTLEER